jgi:hypothetical protein
MRTYFFTFLATPTPDAEEFTTSAGAYVDCWIQDEDRDAAQARAADLIDDYGWEVEDLEGEAVVTSADYEAGDENKEFYEQALVEGEVLVFHTWPHEADDAATD